MRCVLLDFSAIYPHLLIIRRNLQKVLRDRFGLLYLFTALLAGRFRVPGDDLHLVLNLVHNLLDSAGALLTDLSKVANLIRYHRESLAMFSRTRSFDCGVQSEQIRLVCDPCHRMNDLADLLRLTLQLPDHLRGFEVGVGRIAHAPDQRFNVQRRCLRQGNDIVHPPQRSFRACIGRVGCFLNLVDGRPRLLCCSRGLICTCGNRMHCLFHLFDGRGSFSNRTGHLIRRCRQLLRNGLRARHRPGARLVVCHLFGGQTILRQIISRAIRRQHRFDGRGCEALLRPKAVGCHAIRCAVCSVCRCVRRDHLYLRRSVDAAIVKLGLVGTGQVPRYRRVLSNVGNSSLLAYGSRSRASSKASLIRPLLRTGTMFAIYGPTRFSRQKRLYRCNPAKIQRASTLRCEQHERSR